MLSRHSMFIFLIVALFLCAQPLQPENIKLEKIWQEISITEQYEFISPQVDINCICGTNQKYCDRSYNDDSQYSSVEICIIKNVSARAQCSIKIRPATNENQYTAYKIYHSQQHVYFRISYQSKNTRQFVDVPRGIFHVKIPDNSILKLDTSTIKMDVLNAFTWFYGVRDSNNLRCGVEINEIDEKSPTKQGWYRLNLTTGKYDVDEEAVKNNLMIDDSRCPVEDITWIFRGIHYYNPHGLLQSNLPGKTINEVTGGIVDDVKVNTQHKIITIEYNKNSHFVNFLPAYTSEAFNFSATLTLDKYHNKMIHVIIYEIKATTVNVEIGIPGTTRSMMSFYHEKPNQTHHHRISASVIGRQWVCAYPANQIQRCTCVNVECLDDSIPKPSSNFNPSSYNFSYHPRNLSISKNERISQFSQAGSVGINNNVVIYIGIFVVLICAIAIGTFLLRRCLPRNGKYSSVRQHSSQVFQK